jgi:large subunit ribosomal protein L6
MSRIGKLPVPVPQGVKINITPEAVLVEGPKGKLSQKYSPDIVIKHEGNSVLVTRKNDLKRTRALHGLYRNLVNNMLIGVSKGFSKALAISGVGYRAEMKGKNLQLSMGFSNVFEYPVPEGIKIDVESQTRVVVSGFDKVRVGQIAAEIRSIRPPEPYKGKGIKYDTETIRRKVGKTGVK